MSSPSSARSPLAFSVFPTSPQRFSLYVGGQCRITISAEIYALLSRLRLVFLLSAMRTFNAVGRDPLEFGYNMPSSDYARSRIGIRGLQKNADRPSRAPNMVRRSPSCTTRLSLDFHYEKVSERISNESEVISADPLAFPGPEEHSRRGPQISIWFFT